ncbi:MAG: diaminopimelate epimerase [Acidobacteriota bacterium]|nr:diaminopimelate epimerase [Acidobacteriota bacterium]
MEFEKWQALGNDYLIVEGSALSFELTPARLRRLCEAHFGVGADGVLLVDRSSAEGVAGTLRIFNPDGSEAELSGNGAREAALYMRRRGWSRAERFSIDTRAGRVEPEFTAAGTCRMAIGTAQLQSKDYPGGPPDGRGELVVGGERLAFQHVSIGNPQCSIHVPGEGALASLDLPDIGPPIEASELFPNRTNVSWYAEVAPDRLRARIFERGVGETLSSGTGASGAAVAHVLRTGGGARRVSVLLDGGELEVEVGEGREIHLTGWAVPVFAGSLSEELCDELKELSHETK